MRRYIGLEGLAKHGSASSPTAPTTTTPPQEMTPAAITAESTTIVTRRPAHTPLPRKRSLRRPWQAFLLAPLRCNGGHRTDLVWG